MRQPSRFIRIFLLVVAFFASSTRAAQAAETPGSVEDRNAQAVELGRAGLEAYRLGEWARAFDSFDSAQRVSHSPVFLLYMARSKRNQGALLAARALYARVSREMPDGAPEPWLRAAEDAQREAAEVAGRVPSVVLRVRSAGPALRELTLDGELAVPDAEIEVDPGVHLVVAKGSDGSTAEKSIVVEERRRRVPHELTLVIAGGAEPPAPPRPVRRRPADAQERGPNVPAYTAGAVGLAAVAFGATTGLLAIVKLNEIKARCDGNDCNPADEPKAETVRTLANLSTFGFALGAAGLGTSAVLFLLEPAASTATSRGIPNEPVAFRFTTVF